MAELKICSTCCSPLTEKNGKYICRYCGNTYESNSPALAGEFQEIASRRQLREFIQAEELCKELLKKQPESSEGYWQSLLAELGVVYVQEGETAKPTFFSYSYSEKEKIKDSANYKNCIKFAAPDEAKEYERKADELDSLLEQFFELVDKESSYDVFISFKSSETVKTADGKTLTVETRDKKKAEEIFNHLRKKGYRVFFSPVSIGKDTGLHGEKYEPRILKALQTSQAMILVGTKSEYLTAQWVENEWRRFLYYMAKGKKKRSALILGYEENMPSLPLALKDTQWPNFDMFKASYLSDVERLVSFVKRYNGLGTVDIVGKTSHKKKVTRDRETVEESTLSIQTFSDELTLSIDKQLELIEADLCTSRRQKTVKKFQELKAEVEAEGRTDGRILALQLVIDCGLNKISDFKQPENINKVSDITVFKKIIESGGSKDWLHTVLDNLYRYLNSSCGTAQSRMAALEIVLPYDYPRRKTHLKELLDKARADSDKKMFDTLLPRFGFTDAEETEEILGMAHNALNKRQFSVALAYAKKIIDEYEDGNIEAKDIYLLASKYCCSYSDYFAVSRLVKFADSDFESMKDILSYIPSEMRVTKVDGWNRAIVNGLKAYWDARTVDLKTAQKRSPAEIKDADTDAVIKFYDRFLSFYPVNVLPLRIRAMADTASEKKFWYVAMHYYNLVLNDASDKADVYWHMMLCDYGCQKEEELYNFDFEVVDNKYFDMALKAAEGKTFTHIKSVRQKQIDAAEKNRTEKAAQRKSAAARKIKNTAVNIVMVFAFLITAATLTSQILGFVGVQPFFNIWMLMLVPVGSFLPYFVTVVTGIITIVVFVLMVRRMRSAYCGTVGRIVFMTIACALCVTALVFGVNVSEKRIGTVDNEKGYTYENGCIIRYNEGTIIEIFAALDTKVKLTAPLYDVVGGLGKLDLVIGNNYKGDSLKPLGGRVRSVEFDSKTVTIGKGFLADLDSLKEVTVPFVGAGANLNSNEENLFGYLFASEEPEKNADKYVEVTQSFLKDSSTVAKRNYYIPKSLKKVTVLRGDIKDGVFENCEMLEEIYFEKGVGNVYKGAFKGCDKLLQNDNNVTYIGNLAYGWYGDTDALSLREGTTKIAVSAFSENKNLVYVNLPDSLIEVSENAFADCYNLVRVTLGKDVKNLGKNSFSNCHKLYEIVSPKGNVFPSGTSSSAGLNYLVEYINSAAESKIVEKDDFIYYVHPDNDDTVVVLGYKGKERELTMPDAFAGKNYCIAPYAFYKNPLIYKVVLADRTVSIDEFAFYSCYNLYNVTLNAELKNIENFAFTNCEKLYEIVNLSGLYLDAGYSSNGSVAKYADLITDDVNYKSNFIKSGDFVFYQKKNYSKNILICCLSDVKEMTLPADCDGEKYEISNYAFCDTNVEKVVVNGKARTIGGWAFMNCKSLKSVEIGSYVEAIYSKAFYGCDNLKTAKFSERDWHNDVGKQIIFYDEESAAYCLTVSYVDELWLIGWR